MEELYRMLLRRPAEAIDISRMQKFAVDLGENRRLRADLDRAANGEERRAAAERFGASGAFLERLDSTQLGKAVAVLGGHLEGTGKAPSGDVRRASVADLKSGVPGAIVDETDSAAATAWLRQLVAGNAWKSLRETLSDSVLAVRSTPRLHGADVASLVLGLRTMKLVEEAAGTDAAEIEVGAFLEGLLLDRTVSSDGPPPDLEESENSDEGSKREELEDVTKAIERLMATPRSMLARKESREPVQPTAPFTERERGETTGGIRKAFTIREHVTLPRETLAWLPSVARKTLARVGLEPEHVEFEDLVKGLKAKQQELVELQFAKNSLKFMSGTLFPALDQWKPWKGVPPLVTTPLLPIPEPLPFSCLKPAGVADLLIVRQQLKGYEGGDIAHVENALDGEFKDRLHRRKRTTEELFTAESETERTEERETQTTSRFEMRSEVQEQIDEEISAEAGVKVSAKYGLTVEVEADARFAYKNARSESRQRATSLAKETVDRAASKLSDRIREERSLKLVEEVEETNQHQIDARGVGHHLVGVYQWLNKKYEAQVFNYGLRMMYEAMIPEPAAWYIWSLNRLADQATPELVPPPEFTIGAHHITESNYGMYAELYGATNVEAPPELFKTVDVHKNAGPFDKDSNKYGVAASSESATLPDGYEYYSRSINSEYSFKEDEQDRANFRVQASTSYDDPGTVPVTAIGVHLIAWSYYVHIRCRRTAKALDAWRLKTWEAFQQGHQQQVADYQDRLAALAAQEGVEIRGRNPASNRAIERSELKKSFLSLFTGKPPMWLNGIVETGAGPFPRLSSKTQGDYVRFFEQAFEWENATYVFYPYFWARSSKWTGLQVIEDIDPAFQDFLTAGYARLSVPVRPGFESAVEHYRQTGQVWSGGDLPEIGDENYLSIVQELKARLDAPGSEVPLGAPWEVTVPTQLVRLRDDGSLPEWQKQANGTWTPSN